MANLSDRLPENVPGRYYVDSQCIDCNLCRDTAPNNFGHEEEKGYAYVLKQPANPEEESQCQESQTACPVDAIGNDGK